MNEFYYYQNLWRRMEKGCEKRLGFLNQMKK